MPIKPETTTTAASSVQPGLLLDLLMRNQVTMHIPQGCTIAGDLHLNDGVLIAGVVCGNVLCQSGTIIVAPHARVRGASMPPRIVVFGTVGDPREPLSRIVAHVKCVIAARASVQAHCMSAAIEVQPGARLHESIFEELHPARAAAGGRPRSTEPRPAQQPAQQPAHA